MAKRHDDHNTTPSTVKGGKISVDVFEAYAAVIQRKAALAGWRKNYESLCCTLEKMLGTLSPSALANIQLLLDPELIRLEIDKARECSDQQLLLEAVANIHQTFIGLHNEIGTGLASRGRSVRAISYDLASYLDVNPYRYQATFRDKPVDVDVRRTTSGFGVFVEVPRRTPDPRTGRITMDLVYGSHGADVGALWVFYGEPDAPYGVTGTQHEPDVIRWAVTKSDRFTAAQFNEAARSGNAQQIFDETMLGLWEFRQHDVRRCVDAGETAYKALRETAKPKVFVGPSPTAPPIQPTAAKAEEAMPQTGAAPVARAVIQTKVDAGMSREQAEATTTTADLAPENDEQLALATAAAATPSTAGATPAEAEGKPEKTKKTKKPKKSKVPFEDAVAFARISADTIPWAIGDHVHDTLGALIVVDEHGYRMVCRHDEAEPLLAFQLTEANAAAKTFKEACDALGANK